MLKRWKHKGGPLLIKVRHNPGVQRGFKGGKRSIRAGALSRRAVSARDRSKHNGGVSALNKSVVFYGPPRADGQYLRNV